MNSRSRTGCVARDATSTGNVNSTLLERATSKLNLCSGKAPLFTKRHHRQEFLDFTRSPSRQPPAQDGHGPDATPDRNVNFSRLCPVTSRLNRYGGETWLLTKWHHRRESSPSSPHIAYSGPCRSTDARLDIAASVYIRRGHRSHGESSGLRLAVVIERNVESLSLCVERQRQSEFRPPSPAARLQAEFQTPMADLTSFVAPRPSQCVGGLPHGLPRVDARRQIVAARALPAMTARVVGPPEFHHFSVAVPESQANFTFFCSAGSG